MIRFLVRQGSVKKISGKSQKELLAHIFERSEHLTTDLLQHDVQKLAREESLYRIRVGSTGLYTKMVFTDSLNVEYGSHRSDYYTNGQEFSLFNGSFHLYHDIWRDGIHFMGSFCVFCNFSHQLSFSGSRGLEPTVLTKTFKRWHFHTTVSLFCVYIFFL